MFRSQFIVVACAIALAAGCTSNKNNKPAASSKQASANWKSQASTTQPSGAVFTAAAEAPTTGPSTAPSAAANPLAGEWQLAVPRRQERAASITTSSADSSHVNIEAGKYLSGEYVQTGNYLLILTRDERLRQTAWKINSNDSLTLVRSPDLGNGRSYNGITLLRAADTSATEADTDELMP